MGRYCINPDQKAKSITISLTPQYIEMLKKLEQHTKKNKSRLLQDLIKNYFIQEIGGFYNG